jgi:hypothetical protein
LPLLLCQVFFTDFFTEGTSRFSLLNVGCYSFFYKTSAVQEGKQAASGARPAALAIDQTFYVLWSFRV